MFMRLWWMLLISILAMSCVHKPLPQSPLNVSPTGHPARVSHSVPSFNQLIVDGRLNVNLHTGYRQPRVDLQGDPRDLSHVTIRVTNGMLLVSLLGGYPKFGPILVDVKGRYLNAFTYRGAGTISGNHLKSSLLDLTINNPGRTNLGGDIHLRRLAVHGPGNVQINGVRSTNLQLIMTEKPHVQLSGVANISSIHLNGDGWFSMYWVKSDQLMIRAKGHSFIQLAGVANRLDLELWDYAHFNGRYLRARQNFAKTHGHAIAEITATKSQHTLATDASDIHFYELPLMKTDFMAFNGAVLDMRDLSPPFVEEYTRYNK